MRKVMVKPIFVMLCKRNNCHPINVHPNQIICVKVRKKKSYHSKKKTGADTKQIAYMSL